jgi:hypothetical protein
MPYLNIPPIWCSDQQFQEIEASRGNVPQSQFLVYALKIGLGHFKEDIILKERNDIYDVVRSCAFNNKKLTEALDMKVSDEDQPKTKTPANVAGFGNDMTRRSVG